jgi:CDP-diacylglycerol--glycerol-3-phosphate 3-phosphatidyltransferase
VEHSEILHQRSAAVDRTAPNLYDASMAEGTAETQDAKTQSAVQRAMDTLVVHTWLRAFPRWIKPNHLTIFRLLLVPVVLVLLFAEHRGWALTVFIIGLCSDFIDGAMARTRGQTTTFGVYADPIADKLLVAAVLVWWVWRYYLDYGALGFIVPIFLGFIVLELIVTAIGVSVLLRRGDSQPSNGVGKLKMVVQSLALFLFLIAAVDRLRTLTIVSLGLLWAALALAMISGGMQLYAGAKKGKDQETGQEIEV